MKTMLMLTFTVAVFVGLNAQDATKPKSDSAETKTEKPKLSQEQLEARFRATLTKATLTGRWCNVQEGRLGSEKKDQVKWAGDTAVIIVDDFALPGSSTYSARVMVYEQTYAGTWSAGDHGGLLSGVITNQKE
jgi:hypothetical protein